MSAKVQTGKPIRISDDVTNFLNRKRRKNESYDSLLRRVFGLPDKSGNAQELKVYWVIDNSGDPQAYVEESIARGDAVRLAIRAGKKKTERVFEVREIV